MQVGGDGRVTFHNGSDGPVDLIADLEGAYLPGAPSAPGTLVAQEPRRVLDTRVAAYGARQVPANGEVTIDLAQAGQPVPTAAVMNVTVTNPRGAGWITVYPTGGEAPFVSNLNFVADQTIPNLVMVATSRDGRVTLRNSSPAPVDLIVDVSGLVRG